MVEYVRALPPHLVDPDDAKVAVPADGNAFRPAGEWWYDPISGFCFQANGYGHFEGVSVANEMINIETGERFGPVTCLFRIRERPGHPLQQCREFDSYGMEQFRKLLDDMWSLNQYWARNVINLAREKGVIVEAEDLTMSWELHRKGLDRCGFEMASVDPKDCKLHLVLYFSEKVDREIREHYAEQTKNPWIATSPEQQKENQKNVDDRRNGREKERERLENKDKAKDEMSKKLVEKYSEIKEKAAKGGLPGHKVDELLEAACSERGMAEPTLTREVLEEIAASIDLEIEIVKYQEAEAPKPQEPAGEKVTVAAQPVATVAATAPSPEPEAAAAAVAEDKPEMPVEFKKMFDSCEAQGLKKFQLSIWLKKIAEDGELYTPENLDALNCKIAEHFAARAAAELSGNEFKAEEEAVTEVAAEPAKAPRPSKTADKAAKKVKEVSEEKTKEINAEMALKAIESKPVVHKTSGEVRTFGEVTKYWFDLQIKIASMKLEIATYTKHMNERLSELVAEESAWTANYGDDVEAAALEQFEKQQRIKYKEDGTQEKVFKPATVKTQYCTFKKDPPEPFMNNKDEYKAFLAKLDPGTAAFYGDAIEIKYSGRIPAIKALLLSGVSVPGWSLPIPTETFRDVVGRLKPSLSIQLGNKKDGTEDSEEEENTGATLALVENEEEDAA